MPPRRTDTPAEAPTAATPGTALALPDDLRADLLRAQRASIGDRQRLVQVKLMAGGVGMFEFTDTHDTVREFEGVVLGSHARNVLWEKPYGSDSGMASEDPPIPACVSNDGQFGVPRQGFRHAALNGPATGTERIGCRGCPYNAWGSKRLIPALLRQGENPETVKGKAVTNQHAVYVMVAGRATPVELILPPTSLTAYNEYLAFLLNHGQPVQAVITRFKQERKTRGTLTWGQAIFEQGSPLDQPTFTRVLEVRTEWQATIDGIVEELVVEEMEPAGTNDPQQSADIPF